MPIWILKLQEDFSVKNKKFEVIYSVEYSMESNSVHLPWAVPRLEDMSDRSCTQKQNWIQAFFFPQIYRKSSSIYSWSISHILENEFICLGRLGSSGHNKEKKWIWVFLSNFWGWFFQLFVGKKKKYIIFLKIL